MTTSPGATSTPPITGWLVSSAGRRGELVNILRSTPVCGQVRPVTTVDITPLSAASQLADHHALVARCREPEFLPQVITVAEQYHANVIIPTIDPEISVYSAAREQLAARGISAWVSAPAVVELGWDKWVLARWCQEHNLPYPATVEAGAAVPFPGPVIAKPRSGSASIGVRRYESSASIADDLPHDYIVQEAVPGVEVTIDFAVGHQGTLLGYCARKRLEVRAGEVSKAVTIDHPAINRLMEEIAPLLQGAYGMLNLQVFLDEAQGKVTILELNPRFGGGFPLAHAAGTGLLEALIDDMAGREPGPVKRGKPGVVMLRYDAHTICSAKDMGL